MILADKIIELRKKQGWSQEDLAQHLGISRQSVSKWESAASIPDLDKILKLSQLFGVSTDYLLKDSMEAPQPQEEFPEPVSPDPIRRVSLEEASAYLALVRSTAGKIALGVSLCILSPVVLLLLAGLSEGDAPVVLPEAVAAGGGLTTLLVLVALGVSLFLLSGKKLSPYAFLETEPIELLYGVTGIVEKQKAKYEPTHTLSLVVGVVLCILSAVPIMVAAAFDSDLAGIFGVCLCLVLVALGVFLLVRSGTMFGAFQRLLEEGDYTRENKRRQQDTAPLRKIYWCLVTAVYLAWSFLSNDWDITWIIWPCAGVLFGAVCGIQAAIKKKPRTP